MLQKLMSFIISTMRDYRLQASCNGAFSYLGAPRLTASDSRLLALAGSPAAWPSATSLRPGNHASASRGAGSLLELVNNKPWSKLCIRGSCGIYRGSD